MWQGRSDLQQSAARPGRTHTRPLPRGTRVTRGEGVDARGPRKTKAAPPGTRTVLRTRERSQVRRPLVGPRVRSPGKRSEHHGNLDIRALI